MDTGQNPTGGRPPVSAANDGGAPADAAPPPPALTRGWLIGFGIAIMVLSFVAAFLGGWLARGVSPTEPVAAPEPTATGESVDYEEALAEILPAGSAVRAGTGVPESGKGYEGDVYIDISTADVYLFQDDWVLVGNIRESAAANLTGQTGAQGEQGQQGEQGEQGEQGAAGAAGTQVTLGVGAPAQDQCVTGGDLYIDTESLAFYECTAGDWVRFGPSEPADTTQTPEPTETPDEG